jgi:hypothetical protein
LIRNFAAWLKSLGRLGLAFVIASGRHRRPTVELATPRNEGAIPFPSLEMEPGNYRSVFSQVAGNGEE